MLIYNVRKKPTTYDFRDDPPSASEAVAKLRLKLRHKSLEELVEDGIVKRDRENENVVRGPHFDRSHLLMR